MDFSFGTRLRMQREQRQIALSDIATAMKVKPALLEALERDDLSQWPHGIYRRAYMRDYARAIGLEPQAVVREMMDLHPDPTDHVNGDAFAEPPSHMPPPTGFQRLWSSAMAALPRLRSSLTGERLDDEYDRRPAPAMASPSFDDIPMDLADIDVADPIEPADTRERFDDDSLDARPLDVRPIDTRPIDDRPTDDRPIDTRLIDGRPIDDVPFERPRPPVMESRLALDFEAELDALDLEDAGPPVIVPEPAPMPPVVERKPFPERKPIAEINLATAADLCTRLSQIREPRDLTPVLKEATTLLGGVGLVLWVWDAQASALRPVAAHGYPMAMLVRMPPVRRDADNAIAAAFRRSSTCVVSSASGSTGAIVTPLLAARGCVGALALELPETVEPNPAMRGLASILAAQLVGFVTAPPVVDAHLGLAPS